MSEIVANIKISSYFNAVVVLVSHKDDSGNIMHISFSIPLSDSEFFST